MSCAQQGAGDCDRHIQQALFNAGFREALTATAEDLLSMNVIPVFNENDAILSSMPLLVRVLSVMACTGASLGGGHMPTVSTSSTAHHAHRRQQRPEYIGVIHVQQKEEGGDKQRKGRFRDNDGLAALLAVSVLACSCLQLHVW